MQVRNYLVTKENPRAERRGNGFLGTPERELIRRLHLIVFGDVELGPDRFAHDAADREEEEKDAVVPVDLGIMVDTTGQVVRRCDTAL